MAQNDADEQNRRDESAHTSQVEIERKYAVDDRQLPDLVGVGDGAGVTVVAAEAHEPFTLEAVYYDTDDLALARAKIALRCRVGGHDEGWHVKLPAAEGRTELQWPLSVAGAFTSGGGLADAPTSGDGGMARASSGGGVADAPISGDGGMARASSGGLVADAPVSGYDGMARASSGSGAAHEPTSGDGGMARASSGGGVAGGSFADDGVAGAPSGGGGGEGGAGWDAVPDDVSAAVLVLVRDRAMSPLAAVRTSRAVTELFDADGRVVVEIADDTVTGTDSRQGGVRLWREWEAELGPGAPSTAEGRAAVLDEVEQRLLAAGATVSPSVSKLAQALGRTGLGRTPDAAGHGGEAASGSSVPTAAEVVLAGLRDLTAQLVALDPAVRRDEPDAVHRQRTVVRRLRSVLAGHRRLFAPAPLHEVREALARFGGILGEVRDLEVRADWAEAALDTVQADRGVDDAAARRRLVETTRVEHTAAHRRLVAWMSAAPYFRLLDAVEALTPTEGTGASARHESKAVLRRAAKKAGERSVRRGRAARVFDVDPVVSARAEVALHESRKSARRLRHLAEFATATPDAPLGAAAGRLGDAAERLQDALGEHRDALLFGEYLLLIAARAEAAGEGTFVYGVLYQRSLDRARAALAEAAKARAALRAAP